MRRTAGRVWLWCFLMGGLLVVPNSTLAGNPDSLHWSFRPISRPSVPRVGPAVWVREPIDSFLLQRLQREGVGPSDVAQRETLIRRVTLDLTGMPPNIQEVTTFLQNTRPTAYEELVDRLLASPHYGEPGSTWHITRIATAILPISCAQWPGGFASGLLTR